MNVGRLLLALIGLAMISLTYITGKVYFLAAAIVAFFAGLYLMGAMKRRTPKQESEHDQKSDKQKQSKLF